MHPRGRASPSTTRASHPNPNSNGKQPLSKRSRSFLYLWGAPFPHYRMRRLRLYEWSKQWPDRPHQLLCRNKCLKEKPDFSGYLDTLLDTKSPVGHFLISRLFLIAKHHKQCQQCRKHQITPQVILSGQGRAPSSTAGMGSGAAWGHAGWVKLTDSGEPCLGWAGGGTWVSLEVTSPSLAWDDETERGPEQTHPGICSPRRLQM